MIHPLQPARIRYNHMGFALVNVRIARAGIHYKTFSPLKAKSYGLDPTYRYRVLFPPEEMERAAMTYDGVPIKLGHHTEYYVGRLHDPRYVHPYIVGDALIHVRGVIEHAHEGINREFSGGYSSVISVAPGTYRGVEYDLVMLHMTARHLALVDRGVHGPNCCLGV
jgi:uncharacterized protein